MTFIGKSKGRNSLDESHYRNSYSDGPRKNPYSRSSNRANYNGGGGGGGGGSKKKGDIVYNKDGSINWDETKRRKKKFTAADPQNNGEEALRFPLDDDYTGNNRNGNRMSNSDYDKNDDNFGSSNRGGSRGRHNPYASYKRDSGINQDSNGNDSDAYNDGAAGKTRISLSKSNGFVGGMRLAGAEPEDGYFHGTGTFYDLETHSGTCGKHNKNTEYVAALNAEQMGESKHDNPNCGKEVEVVGPSGRTIRVTIVDTCKTCASGGLDLSPAGIYIYIYKTFLNNSNSLKKIAYEELGDFSHGSIPIKWKFL